MKNTDNLPILVFETQRDWEAWLKEHHREAAGIWLKLAKKDAGIASLTYAEALESALCFGWIDGQKASFDQQCWLQKFTPRRPNSSCPDCGLGLAVIRKQRLAAQMLVVLLVQLAHNLLIWSRQWLAVRAPRVRDCGIVRLVQEVWAIPGRVKLSAEVMQRVRLCRDHPRARDVCCGFRPFLPPSQTLELW